MKILYYSPHPYLNLGSPSGYGTHMREMITAFEKKGNEVLPVIMGGTELAKNDHHQGNQKQNPIKKIVKKSVGSTLWRFGKDLNLLRFDRNAGKILNQEINTFQPDLIYERCNYMQLSGVKTAKKLGITHAMEINSPYVEQVNFLSNSRSPLEKKAFGIEKKQLEMTDIAITLENSLKNHFKNLHGVDESKFLITPDAFNADNIQLDPDNQKKIIKRYDLQGKKVIGYLGSIFEWHGLDNLIKAFDRLEDDQTRLLIVGYGEYAEKLISLSKKMKRSDHIIFTGMVDRSVVFDYMNIMDICTAPNAEWFQSPIKIFEYGAMGKPIIAPDTEPVREVMEHEKDGLLVKPTLESILENLRKILNDPAKSFEMGKSFQDKVLKKYTWKRNAELVMEKFLELKYN